MARSTNLVVPEVTTAEGVRRFVEKVNIFNAATRGAIVLRYDRNLLAARGGDYTEPIVLSRPSGVDARVDVTDPDTADTPVTVAQAKGASVIQSRRAYLKHTRDEMMSGKFTPAQYSVAMGEYIADYKLKALRDLLLGIGVAAIDSMDTPSADYHILSKARGKASGAKVKFSFSYLNELLGKMGDAREEIITLVMHSAVFNDLIADGISNYKIENVGGATLVTGAAQAMGRTLIVVDSTALYSALTSNYYTNYPVLGLGAGALTATIVQEDPVNVEYFDTTKVPYWTTRQNYEVEFAVQGMKWLTATGGARPTDAYLQTAAYWDEWLSDHRECRIVKGVFNAS